ncbi:MAG: glycosyltransferase [Campylobacter sp.]|uniref:glycosyltransferase n=1 Tax=Campylobacter sp. TaxID=205 RepID=UPI002AA5F156|nr:glycosyltransferase [Campylobacter sp.]MCI7023779.1 glycosyltransferase [Campylobacter sp.]
MKTLAYHSPFLPQKSGISHYSSELLSALKAHYDITLVSDETELLDQEFPIITYERFYELMSDESTAFDRVIYNMGNNTKFHKIIYECSIKHSGVVILHDFFISGFIGDYHNWDSNNLIKFISKHYDIKAVLEYFFNNYAIFEKKYPLNLPLIEHSKAVIVHTKQAMDLALKFYKNNDFLNIMPLLRQNISLNKIKAKKELKLENTKTFGVFGFTHPIKQNLELLRSWARVMKDKNAVLFIVGENGLPDFNEKLKNFLAEQNITNAYIVGWTDEELYKRYLSACDVSICLRKTHLGEASAALLDCLNYQTTTITNFSGFDDCAIYVPQVSDDGHELDAALLKAYNSDDSLAKRAKERIIKEHDPDMCAKKIFEITERAYREPKELKCFKNRILVDMTYVLIDDLQTGISRVVWQELNALFQSTTLPVIPVYFDGHGYSSANELMLKKLALPFSINDEKIIPQKGDIFYALDFSVMYGCDPEIPILQAHKNGFFNELKKVGGKIFFLVHDLLPLTHPEFFPYHAGELHLHWCELLKDIDAKLIAISNRVKNDLLAYGFKDVCVVHHGSNKNLEIFQNIAKNKTPTFICVGTIEERKGIKAICLAFERLALIGANAKLIIVGRMGRVDDDFRAFLERSEHENIIYKGFCSDDELAELYATSHALIAASYDEGFGLPLIESGLPVIARDIEIFREVLGGRALYFKDNLELMNILINYKNISLLPPKNTRTWGDAANELLEIFGV